MRLSERMIAAAQSVGAVRSRKSSSRGMPKGYKMPGGAPYHPAGFMTYVGASAMVNGKTQGAFPAAKALLVAVYEGALVPFDTALKIEARWFTNVLMNPSSRAMIRSLVHQQGSAGKRREPPRRGRSDASKSRRPRRGHDGRRHRAGVRACRHRGRADRPDQDAADKGKPTRALSWTKGIARKKATEKRKRPC